MKRGVSASCLDAQARAGMYQFLSAAYLRPFTGETVQCIADEGFLEELGALFGVRAVAALRSFAAAARVDQDPRALRQEYMDLFAVPTGRYVTPFEDVHRGETADGQQLRGPLLGERAVAVKRMYRAAGAAMDRACKELPTHIGVELSFMSFLCEREAAALGGDRLGRQPEEETETDEVLARYREFQTRFLREHLNSWFPQLCKSIRAKAKGPLYRGLAEITEAFLAAETAHLLVHADADSLEASVHGA